MKIINKILKDDFFQKSAVFFVGSMLVAAFNYAYHPVLGRLMNLKDFGEVQTLISLFTQLGIFLGAFSIITVNVTANFDDNDERNQVISELRKISFYFIGAVFFLLFIFSYELKSFLNFQSIYPFFALACLFPLSLLVTFRTAFLQGRNDFWAVSSTGLITAAGRILFAAVLVIWGWKTLGAITGLVIAQALALMFVYQKTKRELRSGYKLNGALMRKINIRDELKYGGLVFVVIGCLAFLTAGDVTIVKHYFEPETAGLYSGISTIAKIIFFITGPIVGVLLPAVKINNSVQKNIKVLVKAFLIILTVGGVALLTFVAFSAKVTSLLIGHKYLANSIILGELSLIFFLTSLINLMFYYFLALRKYWLIWVALLGTGLIIGLNTYNHDRPEEIIRNFLIGNIVILAATLIASVALTRRMTLYK